MKHLLIAAAAAAALAGAAHAQQPQGRDFDTNHDGKVTLSEYKAVSAERTGRMFARLDANKDGRITAAEAQAARPPGGAAPAQPGRGAGMLKRMDTNGDGVVTRAEMDAAGAARFATADSNHDGWLSKGEVILMRQRMG
ncbi:MAG: EF-hand domain-containing protein, partial [Phenylobacterium sp.]